MKHKNVCPYVPPPGHIFPHISNCPSLHQPVCSCHSLRSPAAVTSTGRTNGVVIYLLSLPFCWNIFLWLFGWFLFIYSSITYPKYLSIHSWGLGVSMKLSIMGIMQRLSVNIETRPKWWVNLLDTLQKSRWQISYLYMLTNVCLLPFSNVPCDLTRMFLEWSCLCLLGDQLRPWLIVPKAINLDRGINWH